MEDWIRSLYARQRLLLFQTTQWATAVILLSVCQKKHTKCPTRHFRKALSSMYYNPHILGQKSRGMQNSCVTSCNT
jgi:hypothetical protein